MSGGPLLELCFTKEEFNEENFSVDVFLSDYRRTNKSLEGVLVDLRKYGSVLESELLELINNDYADFVNLSANLSGIDKIIENLRNPLLTLKKELNLIKIVVHEEIVELEDKLKIRKELQQKRNYLILFLNIHKTVCKIENLLQVKKSPMQEDGENEEINEENGESNEEMNKKNSNKIGKNEKNILFEESNEDTSNLIQRVANDFNQLKYYVSKTKQFPFVKNIQERIDKIELTMKNGLETLFKNGIINSDLKTIDNCLRTYAAIDCISEVETLFKNTKVLPYFKSLITVQNYEEKGLAYIFDEIINWTKKECSILFELTRKSIRGYDFLTNSIFACAVSLFNTDLAKMFGTGFPNVFHKNYLLALGFLDKIEDSFTSLQELENFRNSEFYKEFKKKWNVSIYFRLREQEIIPKFELSLQNAPTPSQNPSGYLLVQTTTLWDQLLFAWSPSIFLFTLLESFFSLSLEFLSRYSNWTRSFLSTQNADAQVNEQNLRQYIYLFKDLDSLSANLPTKFIQHIRNLHPTLTGEILSLIQGSLSGIEEFIELKGELGRVIVQPTIEQSLKELTLVKGIMLAFRIPDKQPSKIPSFYVAKILQPLRKFIDTEFKSSSEETKVFFANFVISEVTTKYREWAVEVLQSAQQQRIILSKLKAKESDGDNLDEKIAIQLDSDIIGFGKEIQSFGISAADYAPYQKLVNYKTELPPPQ